MIDIRIATKEDIECLMSIRLEMLKVVNNLPENYEHSDEVINESYDYFLNGDQMTVLASDGDKVIGCALRMMDDLIIRQGTPANYKEPNY